MGSFGLAEFPVLKQGTALRGHLYVGSSSPSIYSIHIHKLVEHCAISIFRIRSLGLRSRNRAASIALARQTAMYLAHVAFSLSLTDIGELFSRDRTTVAHACRVVEELRDDPIMDKALAVLETTLISLCPPLAKARFRATNIF